MLLAVVTSLLVIAAGFALARVLGPEGVTSQLGQAAPLGLAALAIATTWISLLGLPPIVGGGLLVGAATSGLVIALRDWQSLRHAILTMKVDDRLAIVALVISLTIPVVVLGGALGSVEAPLSTMDGAFHVERIQALRMGERVQGWYPSGFHTSVTSILALIPALDSAEGAFQVALGLALLAPLAVFGLGYAVWRDRLAAATGALLIGLTYSYPYSPQTWDGWPLALSILLTIGLWSAITAYLEMPRFRLAAVAACEAAAIILVHGTELYTAALGLAVLVVAGCRRMRWPLLGRDVLLGLSMSTFLALPYLPVLLGWAAGGGAYAVGNSEGAGLQWSIEAPHRIFETVRQMVGSDALVRGVLLLIGIWWAFHAHKGRRLIVIAAVFFGIALAFSFVHYPLLRLLFAVTFPWGQQFRLVMIAAIALAVLEGGAIRALDSWLTELRYRTKRTLSDRFSLTHARRIGLLLASVGLVASVSTTTELVADAAKQMVVYSAANADDTNAMAWLRRNAHPGDVVVNDASVDAGIWAPYKAGVEVLIPRGGAGSATRDRDLVLTNIADLENEPAAMATACALHVRFVYTGAVATAWEQPRLPPVAVLRNSPNLEERFISGQAEIFGVRLPCAATSEGG